MWLVLVAVTYLIGTFPSARIVASAHGVDIRTVGSKNPGASNVSRVLGWRSGMYVFLLDAAKGAVAAGAGLLVDGRPLAYVCAGAAVLGHVFPVWERLRGGKGVATGGGAFAVLSPVVFVILVGLWFAVSRLTKKASLASIVVVALLPVGVWIVRREWWEVLATIAICVLVVARHLGNIRRLVLREEHALS
jgi:glycerol-3-phosphate acyltransferase PlsY